MHLTWGGCWTSIGPWPWCNERAERRAGLYHRQDSDRRVVSHLRTRGWKTPAPRQYGKRPLYTGWRTMGRERNPEAALRSSIPSRVSLPMSAAIRASEVTFKRAVSVEWLRWYADWCSGRRPFEWRWRSIRSLTARSSTFDMNGRFEMGL